MKTNLQSSMLYFRPMFRDQPPSASVERRFGAFVLGTRIHRGVDHSVYQSWWSRRWSTPVVLRVYRRNFGSNDAAVHRLCLAVARSAEINSHRLVRLYRGGRKAGRWYAAMEWLPLGSLQDVVLHRRPDALGSLRLMISICKGIERIHRCGLVHGRLSPTRILVDAHGKPRIGGLWNLVAVGEKTVPGSGRFVAPEARFSAVGADSRMDVYSMGAMLRELLELSTLEVASIPACRRTAVDRSIRAVVDAATNPDPGRRHRSAASFRLDVENCTRLLKSSVCGS